jgi:hypothetical protein
MDEQPWLLKDAFAKSINRSDRTVDLYVKAGKVERQMIDGRAYFRMARPPPERNAVTTRNEVVTTAELLEALRENTQELRALREAMERHEAAPTLSEGDVTPRNDPQRRNAVVRWWRRFVYGEWGE